MFSLLIVLLSFSESLARDRTNPVELKYHAFMFNLNKCTRSCNVLSPKICVPKETKAMYVKAFNMITNKNEAKPMTKHI